MEITIQRQDQGRAYVEVSTTGTEDREIGGNLADKIQDDLDDSLNTVLKNRLSVYLADEGEAYQITVSIETLREIMADTVRAALMGQDWGTLIGDALDGT